VKVALSSILLAGAIAVSAVAADAREVITKETSEIDGNFRLVPGASWTVTYTVTPPNPFLLNMSFSGTGRRENLNLVSYGVGSVKQAYQTYTGSALAATGTGLIDSTELDGPFSVVYSLGASASKAVNVTYYGELTSVPEIGAEGALPALLLVLGSIAVMTGVRKRDQDLPTA
jgi:hypothetical protein